MMEEKVTLKEFALISIEEILEFHRYWEGSADKKTPDRKTPDQWRNQFKKWCDLYGK